MSTDPLAGAAPPPPAIVQRTPVGIALPGVGDATGGGEVCARSMHACVVFDCALHWSRASSHDADATQSSSDSIALTQVDELWSTFCTVSLQSLSHLAGVSAVLSPQSHGGQSQFAAPTGHEHPQEHDCLSSPHFVTVAHAALHRDGAVSRSCSLGVPVPSRTLPPQAVAASAASAAEEILRIHCCPAIGTSS
jgi:hypothetical protein